MTVTASTSHPVPASALRRLLGPWAAVLRTPLGAIGAALIVSFAVLAIVAPMIWGDAATRIDVKGTSGPHLLGTDALGRDVLARVLVATRLSLGLTLLSTAIGLTLGIVLGAAPSVVGRRTGRAITAVINMAVAFPALLLILFFAVVFGVGVRGAVLAIGVAMAPSFARLTQTLAASVSGRDYVAAARLAGAGRVRLLFRHVLPNIAEPLAINATISAGGALLTFSGLSFLGIGVQAPSYDWGRLLNEGLNRIYLQPAAALAPSVVVVLAGLGFSMFGEMAAKVLGGDATRLRRPAGDLPAGSSGSADAGEVVAVEDLRVQVPGADGWVTPVRGVSFAIAPGEIVGLVGESGSGKSLTAMATARLLESPVEVSASRHDFVGESLLVGKRSHRRLLGTRMALVFQDPMSSLNPSKRVGRQVAEVAEVHAGLNRRDALRRAVERLASVRLTRPELRARQYPHELSGGMRQRVMISIGLMGTPRLLIADEPTTALDATVQQQILQLFEEIRTEHGASILLISHDLAVVEQVCDRVLVMYAGRIVEELSTSALGEARHPYTRALFSAVPHLDTDRSAPLAVIEGAPPDPGTSIDGCSFRDRCPFATDRCATELPLLRHDGDGAVACWHPAARPQPYHEEFGMTQVDPVTYASFLKIDDLLALQDEGEAHDQLLFVVIHQSHELWFKLLLHELDLAVTLTRQREFRAAMSPLRRIMQIVRCMIAQWDVLDTMTPAGYLEFRDSLESGSGFQSAQFRELEFTAGLPDAGYVASPWLSDDERSRLTRRLHGPTLRHSFLEALAESGESVEELLRGSGNPQLGDLAEVMVDFDELVALWRSRHVLAVERQIGAKPGTGNSSGVAYLRSTTTRRFFPELWDARSVV